MPEAEALAALVLRLVVGGVMAIEGYRKLFMDPAATHGRLQMTNAIAKLGFPTPGTMTLLVAATQLTGGLLVLGGLFTRVACLPLIVIMITAIRVRWPAGFFGGWDWPLAFLGTTIALALLGPGPWSLDSLFSLPLR